MGNIVNRVFDSSGPEGKVRGTPQQIIEKYNQLARDAQLSNDRVAAENFQQHAEHYTRLLSEAQREQDARREQQEQQQQGRDRQRDNRDQRNDQQNQQPEVVNADSQPQPQGQPQPELEQKPKEPSKPVVSDVIDINEGDADSGLVETPEEKPAPRKRTRKKPVAKPVEDTGEEAPQAPAAE
ncbi:hypothetical protein COL8621_01339 [Actibacterium lipolyticum]|uniref:DUF4167 domain-containing protein n=2 Tax=Actibacterium lipolyticum TaxID=1524263 RepID=A0A238JWC5_9RHOB|nr:hypothetical protein COL8621_01339 [Actibacterium lipolyticum]